MTNSPAGSSSDHNWLTSVLTGFLEGQYQLPQIRELLRDDLVINFDQAPARREMRGSLLGEPIRIPVEERHLRQMLRRYIAGEVSEQELSDWAAVIFGTGLFVPKGETEEERWEAGEGPVWDVLQRLMTPAVFDGLSPEVARTYLDMLV